MKKYICQGRYSGKVTLTAHASSLAEAIKKLENAEEDEIELLNPSVVEPDYNTIRDIGRRT